ncbi:hypothetical protein V1514DRAFT_49328, partial [Lipomyces japonicus]|uniref:uncharacterized protein n=1 Tax=Lipomyces japonicus TaxID=56871 RepID=UPI0034CEE68C
AQWIHKLSRPFEHYWQDRIRANFIDDIEPRYIFHQRLGRNILDDPAIAHVDSWLYRALHLTHYWAGISPRGKWTASFEALNILKVRVDPSTVPGPGTLRIGSPQPEHLPDDCLIISQGSLAQITDFKRTQVSLSAPRAPLCPQSPPSNQTFWRKRWSIINSLYKWNGRCAEVAHLLLLNHAPRSSRFSADWLLNHNLAALPDLSQCALCQAGLDTQQHRFCHCCFIAP